MLKVPAENFTIQITTCPALNCSPRETRQKWKLHNVESTMSSTYQFSIIIILVASPSNSLFSSTNQNVNQHALWSLISSFSCQKSECWSVHGVKKMSIEWKRNTNKKCRTVEILPDPRGRKSRPTTLSRTDDLPELYIIST